MIAVTYGIIAVVFVVLGIGGIMYLDHRFSASVGIVRLPSTDAVWSRTTRLSCASSRNSMHSGWPIPWLFWCCCLWS